MEDVRSLPMQAKGNENSPAAVPDEADSVSTHVLVSEDQVQKLRELSRRTRVAQSEYLREAVDDLLGKYGKSTKEEK